MCSVSLGAEEILVRVQSSVVLSLAARMRRRSREETWDVNCGQGSCGSSSSASASVSASFPAVCLLSSSPCRVDVS